MIDSAVVCLIPAAVFAMAALGGGATWWLLRSIARGHGRRWADTAGALRFGLRAPDMQERQRRGVATLEAIAPEQWLHRRGKPSLFQVAVGRYRERDVSIQMCRRDVGPYRDSRVYRHTLIEARFSRRLRLGLCSPYEHWNVSARLAGNDPPPERVHRLRALLQALPLDRLPPLPEGYGVSATDDVLCLIREGYDFDTATLRAGLDWLVEAEPMITELRARLPPSSAEAAIAECGARWAACTRLLFRADEHVVRGLRDDMPVEIECVMEPSRRPTAVLHTRIGVDLPRRIAALMRFAASQAGAAIANPPSSGASIGP